MNRRKPQPLVILLAGCSASASRLVSSASWVRNSSTLGNWRAKTAKLFQVFHARAIIRVVLLQVILVAGFNHQPDHLRSVVPGRPSPPVARGWPRIAPRPSAAFLGTPGAHPGAGCERKGSGGLRCCCSAAWRIVCRCDSRTLGPSDSSALEKRCHSFSAPLPPMPGSSCASRLNESSSRGLVTSFRYAVTSLMCACSKNRMPLVMLKGMLPSRQLELQLQRVKVRPVQHRHLVQVPPFLAQFEHALRHERRLFARRRCMLPLPAWPRLSRRREFFRELVHVGG